MGQLGSKSRVRELGGYDCGQEEACSQDVTISFAMSKHLWGREISGGRGGRLLQFFFFFGLVSVAFHRRRSHGGTRANLIIPTTVPGSCQPAQSREGLDFTPPPPRLGQRGQEKFWEKVSEKNLHYPGCLWSAGLSHHLVQLPVDRKGN